MLPVGERDVRTFFILTALGLLLAGGIAGGWVAMNYYAPGTAGTPAHAGAVSNGKLDECTNVNFSVRPRQVAERTVALRDGDLVRGTFEVDGGFGRVDILLRVATPNDLEILASPRTDQYDFTFPADMHGDYVFEFDNRYSMYTSKSVALFYCIERQP